MKKIDFVGEVLKKGTTIGAILPSSKSLVRKMLSPVNFRNAKIIVELGPGSGMITKEIIRKKNPSAKLLLFEVNAEFYQYLQTIADGQKEIQIFNRSAELLPETLQEEGIGCVDYVISSVPLVVLPKRVSEKIIESAYHSLCEEGLYIQYQYSLTSRRKLKSIFKDVQVDFTIINVPPAFIYICKR